MKKEARAAAWDYSSSVQALFEGRLASKVRESLPRPRITHSLFTNSGCKVLRLPYSGSKNRCPSSSLCWEGDHKNKACMGSMGGSPSAWIVNSVCNQPKPESLFRLFSLSTDSQFPVFILYSFVPLIHFSCTSQSPSQRENAIRVECLPEWNTLTFQNNKLSLRCFRKARIKCHGSCCKKFNRFHVDLNKQN